ncbi:transmembrane protease serine 9 [Pteronotus mesoamericanus]|uniref:transmembrane protease serine 9 n=1 Tax=Pteronotus mesoamericanus TaxID=1884717 RepID=UPI0023ED21EC|nr:kallikrein-11 [Pteronotus parnellii mesoamericanus]
MGSSIFLLLCVIGLSHASTEKIFNGTECVPHSQPWQVGLFEGTNLRCGGVLVDRRWVLTAAHCSGSRYWVRLGEHSLSRLDWTEQIRRSGFSVTYPEYQGARRNHEHDLRLLRLGTPILLTRSVQPLALATSCAAPGTECHVSGWGTTNRPWNPFPDRLQCLNISIVSTAACRAVFPGRITDNMVCAGGIPGEDACQGDSGGPLVCGGVLQGLVSWGSVGPCGQGGIPGVYTNICKYVNWIRRLRPSLPQPAPARRRCHHHRGPRSPNPRAQDPGACPLPLQAMRILRFITLALVTGHVGGETRIIKGYECPPHSQPWQAALFQNTRLLCGATLIARKWVLTAAHCRKPWCLSPHLLSPPARPAVSDHHLSHLSQYTVHLGEHNLQRPDHYTQIRMATESFPHPDFNNSLPNKDHRNDIMLVKLAAPVFLTRAVRPLTLSSHCVAAGTQCLISGWGSTTSPQLHLPNTLRCANITIISHKECENAYPGNITNTMVCASVRESLKDSCQGDSGGPLVCNGSLQGIISWGQDPCAITRKPGVYTKVCKYVDWIRETMKNN